MAPELLVGIILFLVGQLLVNIFGLIRTGNRLTRVETHIEHLLRRKDVHEKRRRTDTGE